MCSAYVANSTTVVGIFPFITTPRVKPDGLTAVATSGVSFSSAANFAASAITFADASLAAAKFILTVSGATSGQGGYIFGVNGAQFLFTGCEL